MNAIKVTVKKSEMQFENVLNNWGLGFYHNKMRRLMISRFGDHPSAQTGRITVGKVIGEF